MLAGCGGTGIQTEHRALPYPATGLILLSLTDGSLRAGATVGTDPVAVAVSDDGETAYVADNDPGDVYAVGLPGLSVRWKTHLRGAPFGLLLHRGRLFVSLYDAAAIVELDPSTGAVAGRFPAVDHAAAMTVDPSGDVAVAGGGEFGIATVGGNVWTADYRKRELVDLTHPRRVALPLAVSPFWLSPGAGGTLLVAAEGPDEDVDLGAVLSYNPMDGTFTTLAQPRDPDQIAQSGSRVLVAAHGEHAVLSISGPRIQRWATGASAVALAADPRLNLVAVVVNQHE